MSKTIEYIDLDKLKLDKENPRLPLSFREQDLDEKAIINWMLEDASIIELMLAIGQNDFFVGESLLVIEFPKGSEKYIVIEGNRRLTSLKLLQDSTLAEIHLNKIKRVYEETSFRPTKIPCIVFEERKEILQYLGFRHVTGIKSWGMLEKARYLYNLKEHLENEDFTLQTRELAKKIGSRSDYVKRMLVGYSIYLQIKDNSFYKIPQLDDTTLYFNYIADSLNKENIREFIGIDFSIDNPLEKIDNANLEQLINWFFRKNEFNKTAILGNSEHLKALNKVLGHEKALQHFKDKGNFWEAHEYIDISPDTFHGVVKESLRYLEKGWSLINNIEYHSSADITILTEIQSKSKSMIAIIKSKDEED